MHQIQKYILRILTYQAVARFSQLRPPRTDSNLFSYHLKALIREGLLVRTEGSYMLSPKGLFLVDRVSMEKFEPRLQPKIITMTLLQDEAGRIGMQQRMKQPFIGQWTLPSGKIHLDETLAGAVQRELAEKAGVHDVEPQHRGDCYIHAYLGDVLVSSVFVHMFFAEVVKLPPVEGLHFMTRQEIEALELLPGVSHLIEKTPKDCLERFFIELTDRR